MAVLSLLLALVFSHGFFESWGWLVGPLAWMAVRLAHRPRRRTARGAGADPGRPGRDPQPAFRPRRPALARRGGRDRAVRRVLRAASPARSPSRLPRRSTHSRRRPSRLCTALYIYRYSCVPRCLYRERAMEQGETRRDAIVEAMIRVAGGKGYLATSVADVLAEAGASRTTFYKHFGDKQECFLAAYDLAIERILGAAEAACERGHRWRDRARSGLGAVVELLAADPALARTAIVEFSAAGAEARRRHWATIGRFARLLESDRPRQRQRAAAEHRVDGGRRRRSD